MVSGLRRLRIASENGAESGLPVRLCCTLYLREARTPPDEDSARGGAYREETHANCRDEGGARRIVIL